MNIFVIRAEFNTPDECMCQLKALKAGITIKMEQYNEYHVQVLI
jgi:hypothetical protein